MEGLCRATPEKPASSLQRGHRVALISVKHITRWAISRAANSVDFYIEFKFEFEFCGYLSSFFEFKKIK